MNESQIDFINDDEIVPADQQETEEDVSPSPSKISEAVLFNTDWTVETLSRQIEKGNINLDPQFQRREAWDPTRKSKFIESILCGFPIPNVVLAEDRGNKGRYLVIDGKQRLFSIATFLRDEFDLKGLAIRADLNNKRFSGLNRDDTNAIENYPIRTVIIRNWPDEDYLYSVFYRLNSGSLPLSPQELRKALHGGRLLDYIDEYTKSSEPFKKMFGEKPDRRMRDVELVLRFVSFERALDQYNGNLKKFLDDAVIFYDSDWESKKNSVDSYLLSLDHALTLAHDIFGSDAFKKWNGDDYERRINRAVFDVITRYFADSSIADAARFHGKRLVGRFKDLCEDNDFKNAIERTTKTPAATHTRYRMWGNALAEELGKRLDLNAMKVY